MAHLVWLVPLFPLLGFLIIGLLNRNLSKNLSGIIGSGSVFASLIVSLLIYFEPVAESASTIVPIADWIHAGNLHVAFSFVVDPLSTLFLLIITFVGFLIHVFSIGYMHDDDGFRRFFAYLNLFVFFMLLLVLGDNFLVMFVGWEGVGLCSYLLIGFWFKNIEYDNAAKKAFIVNRIGDLGFLLGIILIYYTYGAIDYTTVFGHASQGSTAVITTITILLFIGATGKSAQIPLYTWLPDAMAGPTPVSALIHAATMVTAGIYMISRSAALFSLAPVTMEIVATVGLLTALLGAIIGLFQNDIKKVLAYSTVSQLGLMFLGLGFGAFSPAVFHVTTHAFFKALLFLAAGSVIHGMSGEQDIRSMGGLKSKLPITHITFLIGTLAISGIPPFAGFFSKDEILVYVFEQNALYGWIATFVSFLTTFYMFRLYFLTFWGDFRGSDDQAHHLHESPSSMTVPLMVLALLSTVSGFWGYPQFEGIHNALPNYIEHYLHPVFGAFQYHVTSTLDTEGMFMLVATLGLIALIFITRYIYLGKKMLPAAEEAELSPLKKLIYNKFYVDQLYENLITKPLDFLSGIFYQVFDKSLIDGFVNGLGTVTGKTSGVVRQLQKGSVDFYFFIMVISIVLILLYTII